LTALPPPINGELPIVYGLFIPGIMAYLLFSNTFIYYALAD